MHTGTPHCACLCHPVAAYPSHPPPCARTHARMYTHASVHERHKANILSVCFVPIVHPGTPPAICTSCQPAAACAELLPGSPSHPPSCACTCTRMYTYASVHERHEANILSVRFVPIVHSGNFPVICTSVGRPHHMCARRCSLRHVELWVYGFDINPYIL